MEIEKNIPIPDARLHHDGSNKFHNGINSYKWKCITKMLKMEDGDSMRIEDRARDTILESWLWRAERKTGFKFIVKSIDKNTQRVWMIK